MKLRLLTMRLIAGLALLWWAGAPAAAQKITTGPPKLEVDAGAQEGPSWDPAGYLYFVGRNQVSRLNLFGATGAGSATPGKVDVFMDHVAGPNTSVVDTQGRVLVCESAGRRVTRTGKDGEVTVLADNYEGKKLNSPNDISL